jgi:hypothetical protein
VSETMNITPDFSEAVEFSDEQVKPGVYKVRVDSWQNKVSKAGASYIQWKLVIFGAEGDFAKSNNRPLFVNTMLKGPGAGILKQFLVAALGELPTDWSPGWQNALIGREMQITATKNINPNTGEEGFPNVGRMKAITQ